MINAKNYLKSYRERTGVLLQDIAVIIGMNSGNLSKIENDKREMTLLAILGYHFTLDIPIEKLFKDHYPEVLNYSLRNSLKLKDELLDKMITPNISHRIILLDSIIDRLKDLGAKYGA